MKQYYDPKEAQSFFHELQNDLIQDRQEEHYTASPLYYGIMDNHPVVTAEGYENSVSFYHADSGYDIDTLDDLLQTMDQDGDLEELLEKVADDSCYEIDELYDREKKTALQTDISIWADPLHDLGWDIIYMQDNYKIDESFVALTRKAAQQHLDINKHHYSDKAHTYGMCGCRTPQFEQLIAMLHQIDWENSKLVMRVPDCGCYTESEMSAYLQAYLDSCSISDNTRDTLYQTIWNHLINLPYLTKQETRYWLQSAVKTCIYNEIRIPLEQESPLLQKNQLPPHDVYMLHLTRAQKEAITNTNAEGRLPMDYLYEQPRYDLFYHSDGNQISLTVQTGVHCDRTNPVTMSVTDFLQTKHLTMIDKYFPSSGYHIVFSTKEKED